MYITIFTDDLRVSNDIVDVYPQSPHYQDPGYFDQDQGKVRGRDWISTNNRKPLKPHIMCLKCASNVFQMCSNVFGTHLKLAHSKCVSGTFEHI